VETYAIVRHTCDICKNNTTFTVSVVKNNRAFMACGECLNGAYLVLFDTYADAINFDREKED
jgi:hypothetical protein